MRAAPEPTAWFAPRLDECELARRTEPLSADELARGWAPRRKEDRELRLTARLLLRHALSATVANRIPPAAWQFAAAAGGKPALAAPDIGLHFNVAHAGALVAVIVDGRGPVGIDVEPLPVGDAVIPQIALSARERARLDRQPADLRAREFAKLWTMKEALAKRTGEGIAADFARLEPDTAVGADAERLIVDGALLETRTLELAGVSYRVSVALAPGRAVRWRTVDLAADRATVAA